VLFNKSLRHVLALSATRSKRVAIMASTFLTLFLVETWGKLSPKLALVQIAKTFWVWGLKAMVHLVVSAHSGLSLLVDFCILRPLVYLCIAPFRLIWWAININNQVAFVLFTLVFFYQVHACITRQRPRRQNVIIAY